MRETEPFQILFSWGRLIFLALMFWPGFSGSARAQEAPTITISKGDKISLTISSLGGSEGGVATRVLQNDLALSGYFTISADAGYTARGSATTGNSQLGSGGGSKLRHALKLPTRARSRNAKMFHV